jgi:hypothetical protein
MALVKSLVSGFVGYTEDGSHREIQLETGQELDADAVIVLARPELFTAPPDVFEVPASPKATPRKATGR